jgi:phosphoribosyl 1,2-cyclic phosphodiesterase
VRVHFCGVRGSTPAPGTEFVRYGGFTSCVAVARDGADAPTLLLDAGTGVRRVTSLLGDAPFNGTILLSHLHWDHTHGLPFFKGGDRDDALVSLLLPDQLDGQSARDVLARGMSPPHFPISPEGLRGTWRFETVSPGTFSAEGFTVTAVEVPHKGGRTFGYRVSDGRTSLAYVPDHCPTALGPGDDGLGVYHDAAVALAGTVDLLVHDAQLTADEVAAEASFGHAAAEYAVGLGRAARSRRTVLFHHKPDRTDEELDRLALRFAAEGDVAVAAEDLVVQL